MSNEQQKKKLIVYQPLIYALVMVLGMIIGFKVYSSLNKKPVFMSVANNTGSLSQINDIISFVEQRYVDTIDTKNLVDDAIAEILNNLDPHSVYIPPEDMETTTASLEGKFEGIGVEFFILNDTISVITPITGGPSEALGILSGDKIVTIEKDTVAGNGIKNKDVIDKLRGKKGTVVNVGIKRYGMNDLLSFDIKRDKIPLNSVDVGYMIDESVGYIKISKFSETTYNEFADELIELKSNGLKDLIIDLRQNPGGYLVAATNIIDELLGDKRLIVYTEGRNHKRSEYKARRKGIFESGRLVVLIDEGSASASEILAGAIQDWDRGTIVGRRSFGKGLVQEQYRLQNGGALRLTVAEYFTPTGRSIQKPYDIGDNKAYAMELNERYESGELMIEDSIKTVDKKEFKTALGRTVYGGGGITPDVFAPIDTLENNPETIFANSQIASFAYDYYGKNKNEFIGFNSLKAFVENYSVSNNVFNQFLDFLNKEDEKSVAQNTINKNKQLFGTKIKAFFAKQIWKNKGYYSVIQSIDSEVNKAYDLIKEDKLVFGGGV